MRWDELKTDRDEQLALPGLDGAGRVIRTFDAPEALGIRFHEVRAKSALNRVPEKSRMPFRYTVNAFRGCSHACTYCFARPTHTYLDMNAGRDFEREIIVKVNVPELLSAELKRPAWKRELVAFGTNTDPYQWAEGRYKLMPPMIEALAESRTPFSILTKSSLVMRDLDLLKARRRSSTSASTSRSRPSRRRPGARPSRTPRTRASGSRPWPRSTAPGSPPGS